MKKYTSKEIRQMWLDFFESKGHEVIESKSLIPVKDPSLLWINSGVATLKDYFSGKKIPSNPRITNSQKSIRTNDIENVGVTARHHTFFEMLGNFSIGDYFKTEAIAYAYEMLFDVFKFDKDKIYFTYFEEDNDTYNEWIKLGIDPSHLIKGDRDMNFWDVGQGPCGPDTEIFYDRGEKYDPEGIGIKLLAEDLENDRYVEIWNVVFSQFNNDGEGNYEELKQKNIDTGAGLERIVSIFQDAPTNFDTDLFLPIIREVEKMTDFTYDIDNYFKKDPEQAKINRRFRVIADHMRAVIVAIQDGAKPSNTQRGYIIRRLIRRAYRSGIQLGIKETTFAYKLIDIVEQTLAVYKIDKEKVSKIIKKEELAFAKTIKQGEEILFNELSKSNGELDAKIAFKLFETYGFPVELTQEIVEEKGIKLDISKFDELKKKHADASRGEKLSGMESQIKVIQTIESKVSEFVGYDTLTSSSKVLVQAEESGKNYVLLDKTPFYATKGGQHYDKGTIGGVEVLDVFRDKYENHWHVTNGKVENNVEAIVNPDIRLMKERNHTSTHLLGLALSMVFGIGAIQLGSDNNEDRLRLDFPLDKKPTKEELSRVEEIVNDLIKQSIDREYHLMKYNDAIQKGVIALQGEEYGDGDLRVVIFDKSKEFCGGTHILNTNKIEKFKITKLESKGSGVYRIEAITSFRTIDKYESKVIDNLKEQVSSLVEKITKIKSDYNIVMANTIHELELQLEQIKEEYKKFLKDSKNNIDVDTDVEFIEYNGMKAYINLDLENPASVKTTAITIRNAHNDALIIVGSKSNGKQTLAVASNKYNSKEQFDIIASKFNGRGGGNEGIAMGSTDIIGEL